MKLLIFSILLLFFSCQVPSGFIVVTDIETGVRYEIPPGAPQFEDLAPLSPGDTARMFAPDMRLITVKIEKL